MELPEHILGCIRALNEQGFEAYVVGGCVRDHCLGLIPHDYDMCTAALPEQTEQVFANHRLVLAGKKHGTVGIVTAGDVVEIVGPDCKPFELTVPMMTDLEGNVLSEPRTPQSQFRMQLPKQVPVGSFVRHSVDLSAKD